MSDGPSALAAALMSRDPRSALSALRLTDPALQAVRRAAEDLLGPVRLARDSPAARLLLAIGAHPGRSAAELAELTGLDVPAVGRDLLGAGLVESSRHGRGDVWVRTAAGSRAAAMLREEQRAP